MPSTKNTLAVLSRSCPHSECGKMIHSPPGNPMLSPKAQRNACSRCNGRAIARWMVRKYLSETLPRFEDISRLLKRELTPVCRERMEGSNNYTTPVTEAKKQAQSYWQTNK